jgi:hypothetical protein
MKRRLLRVTLLLFGSGMTALIYQVAWMRELRLMFEISTAVSPARLPAGTSRRMPTAGTASSSASSGASASPEAAPAKNPGR